MKSWLFGLFLILVLAVHATSLDDQYIVVVGKDASPSDVILAANFAAQMKSTLGVAFTSAIDEDLYIALPNDEFASKTIVVIDGETRSVRILGTSNAAAAADTYFTAKGYDTTLVTGPAREDVLLHAAKRVNATNIANSTNTTNASAIVEKTAANLTTAPVRIETVQEVKESAAAPPVKETLPEPVPIPKARENAFLRVWRWFVDLF